MYCVPSSAITYLSHESKSADINGRPCRWIRLVVLCDTDVLELTASDSCFEALSQCKQGDLLDLGLRVSQYRGRIRVRVDSVKRCVPNA